MQRQLVSSLRQARIASGCVGMVLRTPLPVNSRSIFTGESRWRDARRSRGRGWTGTTAGEGVRHRTVWQTVTGNGGSTICDPPSTIYAHESGRRDYAPNLKEAHHQVAGRSRPNFVSCIVNANRIRHHGVLYVVPSEPRTSNKQPSRAFYRFINMTAIYIQTSDEPGDHSFRVSFCIYDKYSRKCNHE